MVGDEVGNFYEDFLGTLISLDLFLIVKGVVLLDLLFLEFILGYKGN